MDVGDSRELSGMIISIRVQLSLSVLSMRPFRFL